MSGTWRTIESHTLEELAASSRDDGGVDLRVGLPGGDGVVITLCPTCALQIATAVLKALEHATAWRAAQGAAGTDAVMAAPGGRAH